MDLSSAPSSRVLLHKDTSIRVVVGATSVLSIVGSLLIILSYLLFKDTRTKARLILFHLSLADLGVGLANFIGDVANFDKHYNIIVNGTPINLNVSGAVDDLCKTQAFFALFFTISSILWTSALAVYMYFLIVDKGVPFVKWYFRFTYVFCYGVSLLVSLWLLATKRLGYAPYNSSGWCSVNFMKVSESNVRRNGNTDIYATVFGYDLWIFTTFTLTVVIYLSARCYIRQEVRKLCRSH